MPHVVLEGPVPIEKFHRGFAPVEARRDRMILKLRDSFLNAAGTMLLIEALAVEQGPPQGFFLLVAAREGGAIVKIHPRFVPEITDGVKALVAMTAKRLMALEPACRVASTTVAPFMDWTFAT